MLKKLLVKSFTLIITVLLFALAGCGDSSGSASQGEITVEEGGLTKAEFAKRANAICTELEERRRVLFAKYMQGNDDSSSGSSVATQVKEIAKTISIPTLEEQIERISSLGAPEGDAEQVAAYLSAVQDGIKKGEERPEKLVADNILLVEASKRAEAYGLSKCSTGTT